MYINHLRKNNKVVVFEDTNYEDIDSLDIDTSNIEFYYKELSEEEESDYSLEEAINLVI